MLCINPCVIDCSQMSWIDRAVALANLMYGCIYKCLSYFSLCTASGLPLEGGGGKKQEWIPKEALMHLVTAEEWKGSQQASCPGDPRMLASGNCLSREVIVQDHNQSRLFSTQGRGKPFLHSTQSIPATKGWKAQVLGTRRVVLTPGVRKQGRSCTCSIQPWTKALTLCCGRNARQRAWLRECRKPPPADVRSSGLLHMRSLSHSAFSGKRKQPL